MRSTARLLVVLMLFATGSPLHVDDASDSAAGITAHDASAHRFKAPSLAGQVEHCAVCQWLQSLRTVSVRQARVAYADSGRRFIAPFTSPNPFGVALPHLPPRAPPA